MKTAKLRESTTSCERIYDTATLLEAISGRLSDAARTLARLRQSGMYPSERMVMSDLVFICGDAQVGYGYVATNGHRIIPTAAEISAMDQVLQWVFSSPLTIPHRRLLWLRAEGRGWRRMGQAVGLDHMSAKRYHEAALAVLVGHLMEQGLLQ
jgi:Domain of unknown function (DUF6362)